MRHIAGVDPKRWARCGNLHDVIAVGRWFESNPRYQHKYKKRPLNVSGALAFGSIEDRAVDEAGWPSVV